MFAGGAGIFLIVPYLEIEFGLTSQGHRELIFGIMSAMSAGVGMTFAIFLSRKKRLVRPITMMTFSLIMAGFLFIGFGLAPNITILALVWIGFGTIEVAVGIPLQTIAQETVPDHLRGKVFSFINLAVSTSQIIGMGIVSILAYFLAIRGTFIFNGFLMVIVSFIGFYWVKKKSLEEIAQIRREKFHHPYKSD
jgi:sugar phosphate permease